MSRLPCNNHGLGLVEVIIAMFITTVAVLAVFTLQPSAWKTAARSDYLGRAANILHERLQAEEIRIMNPCNAVAEAVNEPATVFASGQAALQPSGDAQFNVTTTRTRVATGLWQVTVRVAWANHAGITESLVVSTQQAFLSPVGCTPRSPL